MLGQTWKSEISEFKDEKTGRNIRKLTQQGNNLHLYFTENSFCKGSNQIIFRSDRASGEDKAPHEDPIYNIFSMDLETGEICQLTDEPEIHLECYQNNRRQLNRLHYRKHSSKTGYGKRGNYHSLRGDWKLQSGIPLHQ